MNFKILFVLVLIIAFSTACKNNSKPTAAEILNAAAKSPNVNVGSKNYSMTAPDGWTTQDTTLNGLEFHFLFAPEQGADFRANMNLLNEGMQGFSLEEYQQKTMETMAKTFSSFKIMGNGTIDASGIKGSWVHCQVTQPSGLETEEIFYIIPKNGIAYLFTGTTKKGDIDKYRNDFDSVVRSFKVND